MTSLALNIDECTSINDYLRKVKKMETQIHEKNYNILLKFINRWLKLSDKTKYLSLTEFKNVKYSHINSDFKHNKHMINKYYEKIIKTYEIKFDLEDYDGSYNNRCILNLISKCLKKLNYKLIKKEGEVNKEGKKDKIYSIIKLN